MDVTQITGVADFGHNEWNRLADDRYPFFDYAFLSALERSGAVSAGNGWQPTHLRCTDNGELVAALPLYRKSHSWGEYVFDQRWAQAYAEQGMAYYPKWLNAIPFTPCPGPRLAIRQGVSPDQVVDTLCGFLAENAAAQGISSFHCLFPEREATEVFAARGFNIREGVQFQWFNRGYRDFADFLATLSSNKRKMVRRERRRVEEHGISMLRLKGGDIGEEYWRAFYDFYALTYLKRQSRPYLNPEFFRLLAAEIPERLLMVVALKERRPVAAALSFVGSDTLYGRYWGCYEEYSALHFEACYYQGLEYCIEHGLQRFDSGAQGEHKIARGFEPVTTYSAHWLRDPGFAAAGARFVARERKLIAEYKMDAAEYLPFRQSDA